MFEKHLETAKRVTERASQFDFVEAVAVAGSIRNGFGTESSDVDIYIYTTRDITLSEREQIAGVDSYNREIIDYWGLCDNFRGEKTDIEVECMYLPTTFIESQLRRVLVDYQPQIGYSTAFWHTVKQSLILYDRNGWFEALHQQAQQAYPLELKQNIVAQNFPLLAQIPASYRQQIAKAMKRQDFISINHRITVFLASYFDILFAVNEIPHPGEKRIMEFAAQFTKKPEQMHDHINALWRKFNDPDLIQVIDSLVWNLEKLLNREGLF